MDPRDEAESDQLNQLAQAFCDQLMACLDECARGRKGLFSDVALLSDEGDGSGWPDAAGAVFVGVWASDEVRRISGKRRKRMDFTNIRPDKGWYRAGRRRGQMLPRITIAGPPGRQAR